MAELLTTQIQELHRYAMDEFDLCLFSWADLPKRAYTKTYYLQFSRWIHGVIKKRLDDPETNKSFSRMRVRECVVFCLHHLTGDRQPYF